jgi:type III pantothenate kinase
VTATLLTLDLGNSRLKVRAWTPAARTDPDAAPRSSADLAGGAEHLGDALGGWLAELPAPLHAALSSVAAAPLEEAVERALVAAGATVVLRPDPGLEIRCLVPDEVGRDRLWAARGALAACADGKGELLVVDLGTALTVDAVRADGSGGVFLGGAIAPGPALLARSLADGAARLPLVEPHPGAPALGRDTEQAIRSGVVVGLRGAARELARAVAAEADLAHPRIVLTGGGRGYLLEPAPVFDGAIELPDLVHRGLLAGAFAEVP